MGAAAAVAARVVTDELIAAQREADKDAAYYLSGRFKKCEWCHTEPVVGRVTCAKCDSQIAGRVPEAYQRDNDFGDVRRILSEISAQ